VGGRRGEPWKPWKQSSSPPSPRHSGKEGKIYNVLVDRRKKKEEKQIQETKKERITITYAVERGHK
jgi:hypothetical protein